MQPDTSDRHTPMKEQSSQIAARQGAARGSQRDTSSGARQDRSTEGRLASEDDQRRRTGPQAEPELQPRAASARDASENERAGRDESDERS
jgi:hypothetical protein